LLQQNEKNARGQQEILDYTHSLQSLFSICQKITEMLLIQIVLFLGQMFNVRQIERLWINTKKIVSPSVLNIFEKCVFHAVCKLFLHISGAHMSYVVT